MFLDDNGNVAKKKLLVTIILGIAVIFGISTVLGSFYTVEQGERAIVLTNGKLSSVENPGLHFKVPFFQTVTFMDVRTNNQEFEKVSSYSFDQQVAELKVSVRFRLDESRMDYIFSTYGTNGIVSRVLLPKVYEQVKNVFGGFSAQAAIQQRARLNVEVDKAVKDSMTNTGLIVESVQIENIDFSDVYERAVEDAAKAKAEVEKAKSELAKVEQEAQQKVKQAEAESTAKKLQADGDAYSIKAIGDAEAYAIKSRAEALKENSELVKLTIAEKWNGTLPQTMIPGGSLPLINLDGK